MSTCPHADADGNVPGQGLIPCWRCKKERMAALLPASSGGPTAAPAEPTDDQMADLRTWCRILLASDKTVQRTDGENLAALLTAYEQVAGQIAQMVEDYYSDVSVSEFFLRWGLPLSDTPLAELIRQRFGALPREERAWLIEWLTTEGQPFDTPFYFYANIAAHGARWSVTTDPDRAVRFARREDAEIVRVANEGLMPGSRVTEHIWTDAGRGTPIEAENAALRQELNGLHRKMIDMYARIIPEEIEKGVRRRLAGLTVAEPTEDQLRAAYESAFERAYGRYAQVHIEGLRAVWRASLRPGALPEERQKPMTTGERDEPLSRLPDSALKSALVRFSETAFACGALADAAGDVEYGSFLEASDAYIAASESVLTCLGPLPPEPTRDICHTHWPNECRCGATPAAPASGEPSVAAFAAYCAAKVEEYRESRDVAAMKRFDEAERIVLAYLRDRVEPTRERPGPLVELFRGEESDWGAKGDYENWTTEQAAVELIRYLRGELRKVPAIVEAEVQSVIAARQGDAASRDAALARRDSLAGGLPSRSGPPAEEGKPDGSR